MVASELTKHTEIRAASIETAGQPEVASAGQKLQRYLSVVLTDLESPDVQGNPFVEQPWGTVLPRFTRELGKKVGEIKTHDDLAQLVTPLVKRGVELVSGGAISSHDVGEGERRGLGRNGTWPDVPGAHFWNATERDPRPVKAEGSKNGKSGAVETVESKERTRKKRTEGELIREIVDRVVLLETDASDEHVGRVLTMSLPALLAWSDLGRGFRPQDEIVAEQDEIVAEQVETVKRMFEAERTGYFDTVAFGCEPYQYGYNPGTTTSHIRREEFGGTDTLRPDAMRGSFRAVRRILEPLQLSGVQTAYRFYTSAGNSWELIQRQVMPDTKEFYRKNRSPQKMLQILGAWREVIDIVGQQELEGSGIHFQTMPMEQEVVYPALLQMHKTLRECGMNLPEDPDVFAQDSESWFVAHMNELPFYQLVTCHPNPEQYLAYFRNEERWSRLHPEAYESDEHRVAQAALLAAFEFHQYERINQIINEESAIALGVEIDEELISQTRSSSHAPKEQTPLLWGRPPRYTSDGQIGGVAHRQPWFYEPPEQNAE